MQSYIIKQLLLAILSTASEIVVKAIAEAVMDIAETKVIESENKIDDAIVLPLIRQLRIAYDMENDD